MKAEELLREVVGDLIEHAADAWTRGAPVLAETFFDGAVILLGDRQLEPHEEADR